jgi:hypothetical protein
MGQWDSSISIDTSDVKKAEIKLRNIKNGVPKAVTRGMNVAVRKAKVSAKEPIREEYTIKKITNVTKSMGIDRATYSNLSAAFKSNGRPIPLSYFQYRRNPSPGVKGTSTAYAQVKKKGSMKSTGGFVTGVGWKSKSGESGTHIGIFRRVPDSEKSKKQREKPSMMAQRYPKRYPIEQLYSPGATEMLNNPDVRAKVQEVMTTEFDTEFNRQVAYLMSGGT